MEYVERVIPGKNPIRIAFEPANWGASRQNLHDQTDVGLYDLFLASSQNNFDNLFQQAEEQRYTDRDAWALITRDVVRDGNRGTDSNGRRHIIYISHAGTEWERVQKLWAPKIGYYVPTNDGWFYEDTGIPFETLPFDKRKEALKRLEHYGIPLKQLSGFWRQDIYTDERFVGRLFYPGVGGSGRFGVGADWRPSRSGDDGVASLPRIEEHKKVFEVSASQLVEAR